MQDMLAVTAYRARRCIPLAGERLAVGSALLRPLAVLHDALLVCADGKLAYVGAYDAAQVPAGVRVQDMGEVTLVPAAINCHTHIQLSHLAGRTLWRQGFAPWLRSLIPLLSEPLQPEIMQKTLQDMACAGTAHVADFTGSGVALVGDAVLRAELSCSLVVEWFGFTPQAPDAVWPPCSRAALPVVPDALHTCLSPVGHALYSTGSDTVRQAHAWCRQHQRPFSLHLAESPEETQMLCTGKGPLVDLYSERVLPAAWAAPGLRPVQWAARLGILGPETLAVHCVQCTASDTATLAASGTGVCLCPRSNDMLAVGQAPVREFAQAGVRLCLGSDGLTSCEDMNVWQDALTLLRRDTLPVPALLRMLTCNAAELLGLGDAGTLEKGKRARWAVLPPEMASGW